MPELPEVETVVRDLRPLLVGRRFAGDRGRPQGAAAQWSRALERKHRRPARRRRSSGAASGSSSTSDGRWPARPPRHDRAIHGRAPRDSRAQTHTHLVFTLDDGATSCASATSAASAASRLFPTARHWTSFFVTAASARSRSISTPDYWRDALATTQPQPQGGPARPARRRRRRQHLRRRVALRGPAASRRCSASDIDAADRPTGCARRSSAC